MKQNDLQVDVVPPYLIAPAMINKSLSKTQLAGWVYYTPLREGKLLLRLV
jgi:hypothetical protein